MQNRKTKQSERMIIIKIIKKNLEKGGEAEKMAESKTDGKI